MMISDKDLFLAHTQQAIDHLNAAFRLAEGLSMPYVQRMIGDAADVAYDAREDVVVKGWF